MHVAGDIGAGLARATLAGRGNGVERDACDLIHEDADLAIIKPKDDAGPDIIRHSRPHMLGQAVKQLYPDARMAIGPMVKGGCYYDIRYDAGCTPDDLERIEQRMAELIDQEYDVIKEITPRDQALRIFRERGEGYKVRLIEDMPDVAEMALYYHQEYVDMCLGAQVPNTRFCKALKRYLDFLEEAKKRDHRRIAKARGLQEEAPGMVFWHPAGFQVYTLLQDYLRERQRHHGYQEIRTPELVDRSLWERSVFRGQYT